MSGLVSLDGESLLPAENEIRVDGREAALVPKDAFKKIKPDEEKHSGYTGNVSSFLLIWSAV